MEVNVLETFKKYRVSFYFNMHTMNPFVKPSEVVIVEVPADFSDNEIVQMASESLTKKPKVYSVSVVPL